MKKVGVVGLGMIGGSLVKAIRSKGLCDCIVAYDKSIRITMDVLKEGTIQSAATGIDDSFEGCEVVFVCVPVDKVSEIVHQLGKVVDDHCIITDVGSTKMNVMEAVRGISLSCPFIGGHPMAGSEAAGYRAARHNLFENAYYVLTPMANTENEYLIKMTEFVKELGALPIVIDPASHDYAVAAISHVPHVLASVIVNMIKTIDGKGKMMHTLAAGGFRDLTRIASSSPALWESICLDNRENIINLLSELENNICYFKERLGKKEAGAIHDYFKVAKEYRDSFSERRVGALLKTYDIIVDVEDQPGIIASIAGKLGERGINIKNIGINNSREMEGGAMEICFYDRESQIQSYHILQSAGYSVCLR